MRQTKYALPLVAEKTELLLPERIAYFFEINKGQMGRI
jgi:hypothetical protein